MASLTPPGDVQGMDEKGQWPSPCVHGMSCSFGAKCKFHHLRKPAAGVSEPQVFHRAAWLALKGGCAREAVLAAPLFGKIEHVLVVLAQLLRECAGAPAEVREALSAALRREGEARLEHLRRVFTRLGLAAAAASADVQSAYRASADACNALLTSISELAMELPYELRRRIEVEGRSMKQEEWLRMFRRHGEQQGEASVRQLFAQIEEALHEFRHEGPRHAQHKAVVERLTSYLEDELALWLLQYHWGFDLAKFGELAVDEFFREQLGAEGIWVLTNHGLHWHDALREQLGAHCEALECLFERQDALRDRLRALGITTSQVLPDLDAEEPLAASWLPLGEPMFLPAPELSVQITVNSMCGVPSCPPGEAGPPRWCDLLGLMALQQTLVSKVSCAVLPVGSLDHATIQAAALEKCRWSVAGTDLGAAFR